MNKELIMPTKNETENREIKIVRLVNAPRELVWKAWTDSSILPLWWGPKGFTNTVHEIDIREGGVWRFTMHGPDGRDYENQITFKEIIENELIAFVHGDPGQPNLFTTTVIFVDQGDKTEVTFHAIFPTPADREMAVKEFGAIEGGNQTLDRMEAIVLNIKKNV
jgi:uncharacterized protein YndB with AHSA1/START domain